MDVTPAIFDNELGLTAFTVERITYTRTRTGTRSSSTTSQGLGSIHPGSPEMLQLLPEEERAKDFIVIYTDYALSVGDYNSAGTTYSGPDRISWGSKKWRVVQVRDWSMFGDYKALAVLVKEEVAS